MKVIRYNNEEENRNKYLQLVKSLYNMEPSFQNFYFDLSRQCDPCNPTALKQDRISIAIEDNGIFIAHATLIRDTRESKNIGWLGFFECPDDKDVFTLLWNEVLDVCTAWKIKKLRGPINGTIWHQYRFSNEDDGTVPTFQGELLCQKHYHSYFHSLADNEVSYYSAERTNYDTVISVTKPAYNKAKEDGFHISKYTEFLPEIVQQVFELSRDIFTSSFAFVSLDNTELQYVYSSNKRSSLDALYTVSHKGKIIGFAVCFKEDQTTLNFKTIAIDPVYQGKGLGNALIHRIHTDAKGVYDRIIYALIRCDNKVQRLPQNDARIFRRYSAYEIVLPA